MPPIARKSAWELLETHYQTIRPRHLRGLFTDDPGRGERMSLEAAGLYLDYSKNRITDETLRLLITLARESGLRERIQAMFRGGKITVTENRAALHVALRAPRGASFQVNGENVVPRVHAVLEKMAEFSNEIRGGWRGHTGRCIRNIVNIGIGGSDLGPAMAYEALRDYSERFLDLPFYLERGSQRFCRIGARSGCVRNPVHYFLEDIYDAGNNDQRPHGPALVFGEDGRQ